MICNSRRIIDEKRGYLDTKLSYASVWALSSA
jgi:hypothetical protein